jgi:hypothetical protein
VVSLVSPLAGSSLAMVVMLFVQAG